jgi:toxin ParE1/3/4
MNILWSQQAAVDLENVQAYIGKDNVVAAQKVVQTTMRLVSSQLTLYPEIGRMGRVEGTRELVVPKTPLVIVYRVKGSVIQILSVRHSSRLWPENFG